VPKIDAFYLPVAQGGRFCVLHTPDRSTPLLGAVLYVHPFAEEMNKSRRMAAVQARAFAQAGWAVLQMDLLGCGDSDGDFADATWQKWISDVVEGARWLKAELRHAPVLWGLRAGCLLASDAARNLEQVSGFMLWHAVPSGKQLLQQFLRLRTASQIGTESGQRTGTRELHEQLARGESIEVAGYTVTPALAHEMEAADLRVPDTQTRVGWIEVSGSADGELAPASRSIVEAWRTAGHDVAARTVEGTRFWQTVEISECPTLINATLEAVRTWSA
jgi:exosortase A-associated hydrolase 2